MSVYKSEQNQGNKESVNWFASDISMQNQHEEPISLEYNPSSYSRQDECSGRMVRADGKLFGTCHRTRPVATA